MARDVADEEIGAGLGEIDGSRLRRPGVDVVAVADEGDTRAVLDDVAFAIEREGRRGEIALEDQQLMLDGADVRDREVHLASQHGRWQSNAPLADIDCDPGGRNPDRYGAWSGRR